jgi:hypothetical protein
MAKDLRLPDTTAAVMDQRTQNLIDECKRQEESCLNTSTALFEWLKALRVRRVVLVVAPIILGGVAAWPLLRQQPGHEWLAGICALLAGLATAIYKALDLDQNLVALTKHANTFKVLQDRFRQAWRVTGLGPTDEFKKEFETLMARMDDARNASIPVPERFFKKAQAKIKAGHYDFAVDEPPRGGGE